MLLFAGVLFGKTVGMVGVILLFVPMYKTIRGQYKIHEFVSELNSSDEDSVQIMRHVVNAVTTRSVRLTVVDMRMARIGFVGVVLGSIIDIGAMIAVGK
jgi:hypothetical protein